MRRKYLQLVVTFATTTAAMEMEQRAEKAEISGRLDPSSVCDLVRLWTGLEDRAFRKRYHHEFYGAAEASLGSNV